MTIAEQPRRNPIPRAAVRPFGVMGIEPGLFALIVGPVIPIVAITRLNPKFLLFGLIWILCVLPVGRAVRLWDPRAFKKYQRFLRHPSYYRPLRPLVLRASRGRTK